MTSTTTGTCYHNSRCTAVQCPGGQVGRTDWRWWEIQKTEKKRRMMSVARQINHWQYG